MIMCIYLFIYLFIYLSIHLSSHPALFSSVSTLQETLDVTWKSSTETEWKEMFQGHPRIGDKDALRAKYSNGEKKGKKER